MSLASLNPQDEWPLLCGRRRWGQRKGGRGGEEEEAPAAGWIQMLEWLVLWKGYGRRVRWVMHGHECARARIQESRGAGGLRACKVVAEAALHDSTSSTTSSARPAASKAAAEEFTDITSWVESMQRLHGDGSGARIEGRGGGGGGGGAAKGVGGRGRERGVEVSLKKGSKSGAGGGGGVEGSMVWDTLHLGAWSLRQCAQRFEAAAVEGGEEGEEGRGGQGEDATEEVVGVSGAGALGVEARALLARQVRVNELTLLDTMTRWLSEARV